jgi:hypothetical protein
MYSKGFKKLSLVKQFEFDDKINPFREVFHGFMEGNYTFLSKNNVIHLRTTEYSGSEKQEYNITYSYEYNAQGYPIKRIATGDALYGGSMDDAPVMEYFYKK